MVRERVPAVDDALAALPAGELHWLRCGDLEVALATGAGGRVAHLRYRGMEWLVDAQQAGPAAIAWGCYPMVPWAGRIRRGQFRFDGAPHALPLNFGGHAIHGGLHAALAGRAHGGGHGHAVAGAAVRQVLAVWRRCNAGGRSAASPPAAASLGPGRRARDAGGAGLAPLVSQARAAAVLAPRDVPAGRGGIATLPAVDPVPGPWDDCFIADSDITLLRGGQRLRLRSDHDHWVVYDGASTPPVSSRRVARRMASPWRRIGWSRGSGWR
jgi:aldose 1-epimerase